MRCLYQRLLEKLLMITRRESKIKPFIIENSWRGKIFSSQQDEGRVKDLEEIPFLMKLILLTELDTFRGKKTN